MIMKKNLFFAAMAIALASCASDDFVGENNNSPNVPQNDSQITFGLGVNRTTRADIGGSEAAKLLGNNFYVMGTKGTEQGTSPSINPVFDNYLVHFTDNTAGTTESNTANWEYVGINPGTAPVASYPKLSTITGAQTIKYWDFSTAQYDFFAFSTGSKTPISTGTPTTGQIGVTKMAYGASLASSGTAYTFTIPSEDALKDVYITDITKVLKASYGKEVTLKFKNLGSKIRMAFYETIPGYSVSDVKFYTVDAADVPTDLASATKVNDATLISTATLPASGTIKVFFPSVGTDNKTNPDYLKVSTDVTVGSTTATNHSFGTLNYSAEENAEASGNFYLGRSLPDATFAGKAATQYYTTVFPVSSSNALTLRVDYKLTATDGSGETIQIYGAKASIPANYTVWQPNYAYTYIFKISDATNGWTTTDATSENSGLYPITFDAVVAEVTDANAEQTTVTTVATPSITTYQQGHTKSTNEYSKATGKDIYAQVMNTAVSPATLISGLTATNSLVYELAEDATEAKVIDALVMRTTAVSESNVTGRNGLVLTKKNVIDNTVTEIINGVDGNPISVSSGTAGKISISGLTAAKSYAYVYIPTASTEEINQFEPVKVTEGSKINSEELSHVYYALTTAQIASGETLTADETPNKDYVYFTVTTSDTGTTTYSYISPMGKTSIPKGCIKVAKATVLTTTATGNDNAASGTFYFDKYITNNGKYAVKVIKIVA